VKERPRETKVTKGKENAKDRGVKNQGKSESPGSGEMRNEKRSNFRGTKEKQDGKRKKRATSLTASQVSRGKGERMQRMTRRQG